MRKKSIIPLIVVVVLVVGVLLIPSLVDVNHYHDRIQADLEKRFARQVSLGKMRLSVVPFRFRVENVVIGEDPHFNTGRAFAQAQELDVRPQLWPLLRGNVKIESLTMKRPQIELVRSQLGVWNFASVGQASSGNRELSLSQLSIENGQVAVSDFQNRQPRVVYDHIDAALNGYAPERPFDITLAARLPGEGAQTIQIDAHLGPIHHSDIGATPFDGKLRLPTGPSFFFPKFFYSAARAGTG